MRNWINLSIKTISLEKWRLIEHFPFYWVTFAGSWKSINETISIKAKFHPKSIIICANDCFNTRPALYSIQLRIYNQFVCWEGNYGKKHPAAWFRCNAQIDEIICLNGFAFCHRVTDYVHPKAYVVNDRRNFVDFESNTQQLIETRDANYEQNAF